LKVIVEANPGEPGAIYSSGALEVFMFKQMPATLSVNGATAV
jgi:hypothetical protein